LLSLVDVQAVFPQMQSISGGSIETPLGTVYSCGGTAATSSAPNAIPTGYFVKFVVNITQLTTANRQELTRNIAMPNSNDFIVSRTTVANVGTIAFLIDFRSRSVDRLLRFLTNDYFIEIVAGPPVGETIKAAQTTKEIEIAQKISALIG
jgi:hypothetical protein